ncbi:hypothetical protein NHX12_002241 [Muraenolepis orangiensis]|uniref:40S ribosomal protein S13 n=1 Tax=Muraenolepis orangiensis TaxID=630683 RepID=A0A9Q0ICW4_9TELE|nr:hypothetical protein NHX12_002241 [Muraenolepis orangiensis]
MKNIRTREGILDYSPYFMAPTTILGFVPVPTKTSMMEELGGRGTALLPRRTKHLLGLLWDHLRMLVQVIYISFMSVFQMFRVAVHLRITDEASSSTHTPPSSEDDNQLWKSLDQSETRPQLSPPSPEEQTDQVKKAAVPKPTAVSRTVLLERSPVNGHQQPRKRDRDAKFRLILVESRIHRLARYYKVKRVLAPNWK